MKAALVIFALSASVATASLHQQAKRAHSHLPIHTRDLVEESDEAYELTERDYEDAVDLDDRSEEDWVDLDSLGVMMERDVTPAELTSLEKRSLEHEGIKARDLGQSHVEFQMDERGDLIFPRSWNDVKDNFQKIRKRAFTGIITWYTKHDLLGPACVTHSSWHPTDKSFASALTIDWPGKPKCGQYLKIRAKDSGKTVMVRVVDQCGGCPQRTKHIDLTKAAFQKLYDLNVGYVDTVQVRVVKPNFTKYTKSKIALYGPAKL